MTIVVTSDKVVYIGSFSKFLFPTLRLAYMVIPKGVLNVFTDVFKEYPSSVSLLTQKTLAAFMKEGHWESYLRRNRKLQKKKHDALVAALRVNLEALFLYLARMQGFIYWCK